MPTLAIHLKTIRDVQEFVRIVNEFPYDVDLTSGRYVVDAKSIMGILSLDLSKPLQLDIQSEDGADLFALLKPFLA